MDAPAAGLRLHLRQAALRPPARRPRPAGARAFPRGLDYQDKLARFLENHDEPRAAAVFPPEVHQAAAVITFLSPGLRFFHQGQFEGKRNGSRPTSAGARASPSTAKLEKFYDRLLAVLRQPVVRRRPMAVARMRARLGRQLDLRLLRGLRLAGPRRRAAARGRELRPQPEPVLRPATLRRPCGRPWRLQDQLGDATYDREGDELQTRGLYLDVPPWQVHAFSLDRASAG